jgi:ABC-type polysaccharide/polyol phosphate export permease
MTAVDATAADALVITDVSSIPDEPPPEILYRHKVRFVESLRGLWAHREIIYTLAERDFRAQYKQATLGVLWAVLAPVAMLGIFIVVFSHIKTLGVPSVPYPLYSFVGLLCWGYFAAAIGTGGSSLLTNKALLAKTQFPRECFPLETMLVGALNTVISWIPLALLFVIYGRAPRVATVWVPLFILIELVFAAGITLAISSIVIQMRDLVQVLPLIISIGLFATPVIWPYSKIPKNYHVAGGTYVHRTHVPGTYVNGHKIPAHWIPAHWVGGFHVNLQLVYGFFNPLGPVIDSARRTLLLGLSPDWQLVGVAALGSLLYLMIGYRIFKRLEVNFADIA